jgi:hypothetical protein
MLALSARSALRRAADVRTHIYFDTYALIQHGELLSTVWYSNSAIVAGGAQAVHFVFLICANNVRQTETARKKRKSGARRRKLCESEMAIDLNSTVRSWLARCH